MNVADSTGIDMNYDLTITPRSTTAPPLLVNNTTGTALLTVTNTGATTVGGTLNANASATAINVPNGVLSVGGTGINTLTGSLTVNGASGISVPTGTISAGGGITLPATLSATPTAGKLGQIITGATASTTTLTSGSGVSPCSVSLPSGVWMITGLAFFTGASNTGVTSIQAAISTVSNNYDDAKFNNSTLTVTGQSFGSMTQSASRIMYLSSTTTVNLMCLATFAGALNLSTSSWIHAVRIA